MIRKRQRKRKRKKRKLRQQRMGGDRLTEKKERQMKLTGGRLKDVTIAERARNPCRSSDSQDQAARWR